MIRKSWGTHFCYSLRTSSPLVSLTQQKQCHIMIWCPESCISTVLFTRRLFVGMKRSIKTKPVKPVLFLWVKSDPNYSPAFLSLRVNRRKKAVKIWNGRLSGINDMVLFLYPLYQTWFCLALVIEDLACGHQSNDEWLNGVVWFHPWIGPKCCGFILANYCASIHSIPIICHLYTRSILFWKRVTWFPPPLSLNT